eukprot:SAG11_NODE_147_length_14771_cov_3.279648_12_plen_61_part_00
MMLSKFLRAKGHSRCAAAVIWCRSTIAYMHANFHVPGIACPTNRLTVCKICVFTEGKERN